MGIFSALLGNAGAVSQEELIKKYGQLLTDSEEIELGFKPVPIITKQRKYMGIKKNSIS
jgi:hypothetical protein